MSLTLDALNTLDDISFTEFLGGIYEHSPWVAESILSLRPFESLSELQQAMREVVDQSGEDKQLELVLAHPELAGKAASEDRLTADSKNEQRGAGLDQCSAEELQQINELNLRYHNRFGFPFIIAVKGLQRSDIIEAMQQRLQHEPQHEFHEALQQIHRIAGFRLDALLSTH